MASFRQSGVLLPAKRERQVAIVLPPVAPRMSPVMKEIARHE